MHTTCRLSCTWHISIRSEHGNFWISCIYEIRSGADISALLHLDNLEVNHKIDVSVDQSLFVTVRWRSLYYIRYIK